MVGGRGRSFRAAGLLALATRTAAQVSSVCPASGVCFKLNIPQNTASSGNGDIFFQLSAPTSYSWVALGQGSSMSGSNIFVVYASGNGNVTLSPRLGQGHQEPQFNSDAQVTLLEGSGVSNGKMIANVRCSSCNSWSGGSASFSGSNGNWIYASKPGSALDTTSQSASINEHDEHNTFQWTYASAKGGNSVNPFLASASPSGSGSGSGSGTVKPSGSVTSCVPRPASATTGNSATSGAGAGGASSASSGSSSTTTHHGGDDGHTRYGRPTQGSDWPTARPTAGVEDIDKRQSINYCDETGNSNTDLTPIGSSNNTKNVKKMLVAHGVLAALAFVIFFPFGAIAIRLASFRGIAWIHGAFQIFAYLVFIAAFGLGVYIANHFDLLKEEHPIIGIVVFVMLFFQPFLGVFHHSSYTKYQRRTLWSHLHLWNGRISITLGIINGGLGFQLADKMNWSSRSGMIAYSVIAGIVWVAWVGASIFGEMRRGKAPAPKYPDSPRAGSEVQAVDGHPDHGHYAPAK